MSTDRIVAIGLAIWTAVFLLLIAVPAAVMNLLFEGYAVTQGFNLLVERNFLSNNATLWAALGIYAVGVLVIGIAAAFKGHSSSRSGIVTAIIGGLGMAGAFVPWYYITWDNDKDLARFYNERTVFHVADLERPASSVVRLLEKDGKRAAAGDGQFCDLVGLHDVPSCIVEGDMLEREFEPRNASYGKAQTLLERTAGDTSRVDLLNESITYLYGPEPEAGVWSGFLDGVGKEQDPIGVAEWNGSDPDVRTCEFNGQHKLDRSFQGERGNSLPNLLADEFPHLVYNLNDVWGYCRDGSAVVVIPVLEHKHHAARSVLVPGGVLIFDGTSPFFRHQREVRAGELPGPVYPMSLAAFQRQQVEWAAGRKNRNPDRGSFGYEPTSVESQQGNNSEFLLRDPETGRLFWVTPLTPRNSDSEKLNAFSIIPADEVRGGHLNVLDVYSLNEDSPWAVNMISLQTQAIEYISSPHVDPFFKGNGGSIAEFTPVAANHWRGFGERGDIVKYRFDISPTGEFEPRVVVLNDYSGAPERVITGSGGNTPPPAEGAPAAPPTQPSTPTDCSGDPAALPVPVLAECIRQFADAIASRQNAA